jgi:hypothetical protein
MEKPGSAVEYRVRISTLTSNFSVAPSPPAGEGWGEGVTRARYPQMGEVGVVSTIMGKDHGLPYTQYLIDAGSFEPFHHSANIEG